MVRNQTHNETDYYMILSSQEVRDLHELFIDANGNRNIGRASALANIYKERWKLIADQQDDRANLV